MNKGEIWIGKEEPLEDEFLDAVYLVEYRGDDLWTAEMGYIEDGVFFSYDPIGEITMSGRSIFDSYIKSGDI